MRTNDSIPQRWIRTVTVARFNTVHEASFARARLAAGGIEAFVGDEYMGQIRPEMLPALGWVKLQVREADVEAARSMLETAPLSPVELDALDDEALAAGSPSEDDERSEHDFDPARFLTWFLLGIGILLTVSMLCEYAGRNCPL